MGGQHEKQTLSPEMRPCGRGQPSNGLLGRCRNRRVFHPRALDVGKERTVTVEIIVSVLILFGVWGGLLLLLKKTKGKK